jgi:putative DNA primase/helicase
LTQAHTGLFFHQLMNYNNATVPVRPSETNNCDSHEVAVWFVADMAALGIIANPADIVADGLRHRIYEADDKRGQPNLWYVLYDDSRGRNGVYGHHAKYPGETFHWRSGERHGPATDEQHRARLAREKADSEQKAGQLAKTHKSAAERAQNILKAAVPYAAAKHSILNGYLDRKDITDACGALIGDYPSFDPATGNQIAIPNALLVPLCDINGNLRSLQAIFKDDKNPLGRDRTYLAGGEKEGHFLAIGEPVTVNDKPVYVICEGFATGISLHHATGHAVIVAFDASNLLPVAKTIRKRFEDATLVIAGDNDQWKTPGRNPGLAAANAAAEAIGGVLAYPDFPASLGKVNAENKLSGPTDFDDAMRVAGWGSDAVRKLINDAIAEAAFVASEVASAIDRVRRSVKDVCSAVDVTIPAKAFPLDGLDVVELKGREGQWLSKLAKCEDQDVATATAWTIMRRLFASVPARFDLVALRALIENYAPQCGFPRGFLAAAQERLRRRLWMRQKQAVSCVSLSDEVKKRHDYQACDALPVLSASDYHGVILVRAPKGSGKTESIMKPYSHWAGKRGGFVAIVHRVSLVQELARNLDCVLYTDVTRQFAQENVVPALATCLPSIVRSAHRGIIEHCDFLAVDEISQTLAFIESETACKSEGVTNAGVYACLQEMVRRARCIIGADAGLNDEVIRFLELCRPGERFRIYDIADRDQGLRAQYVWGEAGLSDALGEMQARLRAGENIWVACDTRRFAEAVAAYLAQGSDRPILCITKAKTPARDRFMADPQSVSLEYAAVIHSPAISSGISIKHDHFSHGFLFYSGYTIAPDEASQMMRRVRPLKDWTIALSVSRLSATAHADAILLGMEGAADIAGNGKPTTEFDKFIASIRAHQNRARIDGAAGLLWQLEAERYAVTRADAGLDVETLEAYKLARRELRETERKAILDAPDLTDIEAQALRRQGSHAPEDEAALDRYTIARGLGIRSVDEAALDVWTKIGPKALDRFASAFLAYSGKADSAETEHLSQRAPHKSRLVAYARLFANIDVRPGMPITQELSELLMSRIETDRFALAWLDIVSPTWGALLIDSKGNVLPFRRPTYAQREIGELFRRMGIATNCRKSDGRRFYRLEDDFELVSEWATQRIQGTCHYISKAIQPMCPVSTSSVARDGGASGHAIIRQSASETCCE